MTIIRITQEHSNTHTEFELLPDCKPMPAENFELARQWGGQGLLDNFTASFIVLIENQRNYYAAIRNIMERKNAAGLQLVSRRDESTG